MSGTREFNAANVDEAISKATSETGIPSDSLSYEVLDRGSDGFLGIGVRDARILVNLPEIREADVQPEPEEVPEVETETTEPPAPESGISEALNEEEPSPAREDVSEDFIENVRSITDEILNSADISTRVDVYDAGDYIAVDLISDHTALLIGQKGETIDALQHIVNAAAYKNHEFEKRIILDSEGYRQRRIEAIQGMANRMARKARKERQDVELPPMSSSERRVVHLFLQDDDRVETFSEGSGDQRRVTISPK